MITLVSACVLMGCLQDVPVVVGDPVRYYATEIFKSKEKVDRTRPACYIEGVFYETCTR